MNIITLTIALFLLVIVILEVTILTAFKYFGFKVKFQGFIFAFLFALSAISIMSADKTQIFGPPPQYWYGAKGQGILLLLTAIIFGVLRYYFENKGIKFSNGKDNRANQRMKADEK